MTDARRQLLNEEERRFTEKNTLIAVIDYTNCKQLCEARSAGPREV